ncbi:MAG: sugar ABC transporter ATP-binding protein [Sphaerochaeta sp.]|nr:sugar ABC transporter ATP-binding protein [Sphaerochaeta sp.]
MNNGMETILTIEGLTKFYPGVKALEEVSFSLRKGEVHALVGENGAGKSTLIKILSGVLKPDSGTFVIDGKSLVFDHPLQAMEHGIAVTYQDLSLFPNLTVAENISISQSIKKKSLISKRRMCEIASAALEQLGISIGLHTEVKFLSVGMQNMVAIARGLANSARILILDEPTASLSNDEVKALFSIINKLRDQGMSILFVSHKLDEVFEISQRTTVLRDGRYVKTFETASVTEQSLISAMVGRNVLYERYPGRDCKESILEVQHLCKKHNFADISFTLHKNEILGFTGLIGAGRTEVAKAIFGSNEPESGEVRLYGQALKLSSTEETVRSGIAYLPESRHTQGLFLPKSLEDNVGSVILSRLVDRAGLVNAKKKRVLAKKWIEQLGVRPAFPDMLVEQFSGGNQQKVVLAKWLASEPKVLIVDEPTHGVDIGAKSEIHRLLRTLSEEGIGVMVISSELPEILALCDRILVMRMGRIVGEFLSKDADQEKIMNLALKG